MASFEITAVSQNTRPWTAKQGGAMIEYRVHLKAADGTQHQNVEWSRKADSPAPQRGQQIEGELEDKGQYGLKFKTQAGGRGGGGNWGPRPEDPKRAATILRQHSQDMTLRYFALVGKAPTREQIVDMTDWFYADAKAAGAKAA